MAMTNDQNEHYRWLESQRNKLMIGAAGIARMTFLFGLYPPGGYWKGTMDPIMADRHPELYSIFKALNISIFTASFGIILLLLMSDLPSRCMSFIRILMVLMLIGVTVLFFIPDIAFTPPHEMAPIIRRFTLSGYSSHEEDLLPQWSSP